MKRILSTALTAGLLTLSLVPAAFASIDANVLPQLKGTPENGVVTQQGNNGLNVKVNGAEGTVGKFNWQTFNVGSEANVNFEFSAHNQTSLNIVDANGGMSQIYGKLTNSGCSNCGYDGTGKVILLNPNGILFGETANVNLNSFTAAGFNGTYDENNRVLSLAKGDKAGDITILSGAKIHGNEAVNLAGTNVNMYNGSKISTNTLEKNFNNGKASVGKVKIATGDGMNFTYYKSGAVDNLTTTASADKMTIQVNGEIVSGNIDIRNSSTNAASELNLNEATLKAVKAEVGNDGNVWLTAGNKAIVGGSNITADGEIRIQANNKVTVANNDKVTKGSTLNAKGDIILDSLKGDAVVENSSLTAGKDINIKAAKVASIQKSGASSALKAENVTIEAGTNAQVVSSTITAKDITITAGNDAYVTGGSILTADNNIKVNAKNGKIKANATMEAKEGASTLVAATDVTGTIDFKNTLADITATNGDANLKLAGVGNKEKGLSVVAGKSVTVETDDVLSVSKLVAKNGDMNIKARKVLAGKPYTTEEKVQNGDESPRSYIYVENGKFNSQTSEDEYVISASDKPINGGKENLRHHIEYGNGQEKILLINPQPASAQPSVEPQTASVPNVNDDQAAMKNKLPAQPQTITVNNNITNNKTQLVDVFAAASQIEIADDEDED